jgi:hypothetical protein
LSSISTPSPKIKKSPGSNILEPLTETQNGNRCRLTSFFKWSVNDIQSFSRSWSGNPKFRFGAWDIGLHPNIWPDHGIYNCWFGLFGKYVKNSISVELCLSLWSDWQNGLGVRLRILSDQKTLSNQPQHRLLCPFVAMELSSGYKDVPSWFIILVVRIENIIQYF